MYCVLLTLLASPLFLETEATEVNVRGYYVESPMFNFFVAPRRAIRRTDAYHITTSNVNNCTCRNACFSVTGCRAWSVTKVNSSSSECRVSKEGPSTAWLEESTDSTYFFLEGNNTCSVTSMLKQNKTLIYSREMMEDVALRKLTNGTASFVVSNPTSNVNDGNDTTLYASQQVNFPWWVVDLGAKKTIFHVTILPRQNHQYYRFHDVEVRLGDTPVTNGNFSSHPLINFYPGNYSLSDGRLLYSCNGVTGRYLSVTITSNLHGLLDMHSLEAFSIKTN